MALFHISGILVDMLGYRIVSIVLLIKHHNI